MWYFDPNGETVDVYDHEGTLVAEARDFPGSWSGDFPDVVLEVMRENYESGGPTSYNQAINRDAATENIEQGIPP